MAAFGIQHCILLTDPSVLGTTATGDVDDIAAMLFLAQKYGKDLCVVICDDAKGLRFPSFMAKYGNDIVRCYGCTIMPEAVVITTLGQLQPNTTIFVHAPVTDAVAGWIDTQAERIFHVFAQGESNVRANFVSAQKMWRVLTESREFSENDKVTFYASDSTGFFIPYDPAYLATLHPKAAQLYLDYFFFQKLKAFGLPADNVTLADQLFSDTGGPGGRPGNGIFFRLGLIAKLRGDGYMPAKDSPQLIADLNGTGGNIEEALQNSYRLKGGGTNETTISNLRDLLWLTNRYCDYSTFLIREQGRVFLPDMGNIPPPMNPTPDLPVYQPREGVRDDVRLMFDPALTKTTNLFDFASAAYAKMAATPPANFSSPGNPPVGDTLDKLRAALIASLNEFNSRLTPGAAMTNGGRRKSRRKRNRKRRNTRR